MALKRAFDLFTAVVLIILLLPPFLFVWFVAAVNTGSSGIFLQRRIGQFGRLFTIIKFRTIHSERQQISAVGQLMRRYKIDEWPQLVNILTGQMSFVGPRPDIPGYYDSLEGEDRNILKLKPGLTSPAALYYFDEEQLLARQKDPKWYNDCVIFPHKVKMGLEYYHKRTFLGDLEIIWQTLASIVIKV